MPQPVCSCGCGRTYTARQWRRLALVGLQEVPPGFGEPRELRNCECGSTRGVPVSVAMRNETPTPSALL